jgi:hypothetical protein
MTPVRVFGHGGVLVALTLLTQVGGLAWLGALWFRWRLVAFVALYGLIWGLVQIAVPLAGRVPLPCSGEPLRMQSVLYCGLMRNFFTPELRDVAERAAATVDAAHPGTVTLTLDGGYPFLTGFPMAPHLSHDDGEKLDFAFSYQDQAGRHVVGQTASPLGYFAFETLEETGLCPPVWLTLRWEMRWFQPLLRPPEMDVTRSRALIAALLTDTWVAKIFVEPALAARLGVEDQRIRFQGCRAARHDDHIHIQL